MKRDEIRLELLKLTYAHGRDAAEAVQRAQVLECYVDEKELKEFKPDEDIPEKVVIKKTGKPSILS